MILLRSLSFLTQNLLFCFVGIVGIGFLIGFHELGHFLFCKLFNIRTPSFSIGFGPQVIKKKIGETEFSLSALPFGGYVEIAGSSEMGQGEQKDAHANDERSFARKPYYQKFLVMIGGILFNLAFAYFALILLFMLGIPQSVPIIQSVAPDSAAEKYHLQADDTIIGVNNQRIDNNLDILLDVLKPNAGKEVIIQVQRANQEITIPLILDTRQEGGASLGTLGVTFKMEKKPAANPFQALKKGIALTNSYIRATINGFLSIGKDVRKLQGPLSIINIIRQGISQSFSIFLLLLALISINLAVLNLIPLPIVDGGQILYYTIEAIIRRPIPAKVREYIHIASWIFVLGLFVLLTAQDVYNIFKAPVVKLLNALK